MEDKVIVIFNIINRDFSVDLEVPLNITAYDLVLALNEAYKLGIDTNNIPKCYLKAEDPIALLKGSKTLAEYGIRNGSIINFTE